MHVAACKRDQPGSETSSTPQVAAGPAVDRHGSRPVTSSLRASLPTASVHLCGAAASSRPAGRLRGRFARWAGGARYRRQQGDRQGMRHGSCCSRGEGRPGRARYGAMRGGSRGRSGGPAARRRPSSSRCSSPASIEACIASVVQALGPVEIVVNNAGIAFSAPMQRALARGSPPGDGREPGGSIRRHERRSARHAAAQERPRDQHRLDCRPYRLPLYDRLLREQARAHRADPRAGP